jgi:hypothetical protein
MGWLWLSVKLTTARRCLTRWWHKTWPLPEDAARAMTAAASWGAGWQNLHPGHLDPELLPPGYCGTPGCGGEHPGPEFLPGGSRRVITHQADHSAQIGLNLNYSTGQVARMKGGDEDEVESGDE